MTGFVRLLAIVLLVCPAIAPAVAAAQAGKEAPKNSTASPPPVPSAPERTTASFGDWVLRCEGTTITPAHRVCEVAQAMTVQGQTAPIAQVAIGKQAPNEPRRLTIVLPTNIAFATKPAVAIAKQGAAPTELTWQRCVPGGCFASASISDAELATLGAQTEPGKILFKDATDRDVALPLSFRGLTQALAALAKEQ
jgi:invasion protein IalB